MPSQDGHLDDLLTNLFREQVGSLIASQMRLANFDLGAAEDAVQHAFTSALGSWAKQVPADPVAWLATAARRRLLDDARKLARQKTRSGLGAEPTATDTTASHADDSVESGVEDNRLRLLFTCCHPSLNREAQVALTLTTLGGLRTEEVARAFLLPHATMAKRLTRAKNKIRDAGIPFRVPSEEEIPKRLPEILAVLYLIFNEGYSASSGESLQRRELCRDARRLSQLLMELLPAQNEVRGLSALLAFQDSRRKARIGNSGEFLRLEEQDRSLWNEEDIQEGQLQLGYAIRFGAPGIYTVQAALAGEHARAATAEETNWQRIVKIYDVLLQIQNTPIVHLNRAVAVAENGDLVEALATTDAILKQGELEHYLWLHSTRADFLHRLGRMKESADAYRTALSLAGNRTEQRFLAGQLAIVVGKQ